MKNVDKESAELQSEFAALLKRAEDLGFVFKATTQVAIGAIIDDVEAVYMIGSCDYCGESIYLKPKNKRFCNKSCKSKWHKAR